MDPQSDLMAKLDDMLALPPEGLEQAASHDEWVCYVTTACQRCQRSYGLAVKVKDWGDLQSRLDHGDVSCECGGPLRADLSN